MDIKYVYIYIYINILYSLTSISYKDRYRREMMDPCL